MRPAVYGLLNSVFLAVVPTFAYADRAGERLIAHCVAVMSHAKTFQAEYTVKYTPADFAPGERGTVWMQRKPAYACAQSTVYDPDIPYKYLVLNRGNEQTISNGKNGVLGHF